MNAPVDAALLGDLLHAADADCITQHVVGAAIPNAEGRVALLHRTADDYLGGLWELPSGGVDAGETLTEALHREVAEETGLTVTTIGAYLGHFDYLSKGGKKTRQFNFTAQVTHENGTVKLTERDAHLWADRTEQEQVSGAVRSVLATWREKSHDRSVHRHGTPSRCADGEGISLESLRPVRARVTGPASGIDPDRTGVERRRNGLHTSATGRTVTQALAFFRSTVISMA
ncbi:NUDIX domain-containing protein [Streptomyces oryzae]|uniref:8-oxo-dGTP diphosphatase n=1 Tax=Streptomyces oryzae TaxID=1434886 RepID=A0ABS3XIB8_9ACTN|nr:NUDIX domain-containing protein [Streptomyces oryzae]MBO8195147.1 NUDIX domain-containing protein [Streptomyces oryzae]